MLVNIILWLSDNSHVNLKERGFMEKSFALVISLWVFEINVKGKMFDLLNEQKSFLYKSWFAHAAKRKIPSLLTF